MQSTQRKAEMVNYAIFPRNRDASELSKEIVKVFTKHYLAIKSPDNTLASNEVLAVIGKDLSSLGFEVETGKKRDEKIIVPVLFGNNGKVNKYFEADAFHRPGRYVLEVEAGRGVTNFQFLKDLFQAIAMNGVDKLCIAIRNEYKKGENFNKDFEYVVSFFDTLFASGRLELPLDEILIIGY